MSGQTPTLLASRVSFCRYYINLCQKIYKGPQDCSERASVCKRSASGEVQVLGLVHTQKLDVVGKALRSHVSPLSWEDEGVVVGLEGQRWLPSEPAGVLFSVTVSQTAWGLLKH